MGCVPPIPIVQRDRLRRRAVDEHLDFNGHILARTASTERDVDSRFRAWNEESRARRHEPFRRQSVTDLGKVELCRFCADTEGDRDQEQRHGKTNDSGRQVRTRITRNDSCRDTEREPERIGRLSDEQRVSAQPCEDERRKAEQHGHRDVVIASFPAPAPERDNQNRYEAR